MSMKLYVLIRIVIIVSLFPAVQLAYSQGCSDAGFCTIRDLRPHTDGQLSIKHSNRFQFSVSHGSADHGIAVTGGHVEYGRMVNENIRFDIKVSFTMQRGVSLRRTGLSDVFLSSSYTSTGSNSFTLGLKVPLSDGNAKVNGSSLPMDLQSSLGTYDLILGFGTNVEHVQFTAAVQMPLVQNTNRFFAEQHPADSELRKFTSTNEYQRKADVLMRISYPIHLGTGLVLTPSILPIYHVADDEYTALNGTVQTITGSKGLTLNMNMYMTYVLDPSQKIELNFGSPLRTRSVRPDGLTRGYVAALEYQTTF